MPPFAVPGATLATEFSDEQGFPVVQLHGLTSSRQRDRILDLDLGRGLSGTRLLRYDARGHGESTGRAVASDYVWPVLADDLLRLLDHRFPGEKVHGVGPSMGAATLLHAAIRDPERFSGLTLMVPPTAWETRSAQSTTYLRAADLIESIGIRAYLTATGTTPPPATTGKPETLPDVSAELLPSLFRGAAQSNLPDRADIALIDVPVSVLAWTDDPSHPLSTAEALVDMLPHAQLSVARTPQDVATWPQVLADDVDRAHSIRG
ncbi:alpha/beta fold hydrolase [Microbacterium amylolyticum]|uniref:Pimeloyl-ACP methyl ester carboxylesterase n=1 Tax=Microbacterium amylolyticum TaxID=936337 RepID=A0ABS4ZF57_9MICO|nr:alpha/beta hydrolase [Microbacterium amylolyticum]MBP2435914.1 pimeloyl-ACP methyl ester carboxylesterase [Microbacterium amylolyticum]